MTVHLICGPPGAGKTTYVKDHAGPDDVVIDLDEIRRTVGAGQASMWRMAAERAAANHEDSDVWVIRTLADPQQRAEAAQRLNATDVRVLATPADLAKSRASERDGSDEAHAPIENWWDTYQPADGETEIHPDNDSNTPDKEAHAMPDIPTPKDVQPQGTPPKDADQQQGQQPSNDGGQDNGEDRGYPQDTPLAEMTTAQQLAYWKHQSRKHERTAKERADYDDVAAKARQWDEQQKASMSDQDRLIQQAREEALAEARRENAEKLVTAEFRAAARGVDEKVLEGFLEDLNYSRYIGEDASVDTARIAERVKSLPQAGPAGPAPRSHQGFSRTEGISSVDAGRAMFAARHGSEPKP